MVKWGYVLGPELKRHTFRAGLRIIVHQARLVHHFLLRVPHRAAPDYRHLVNTKYTTDCHMNSREANERLILYRRSLRMHISAIIACSPPSSPAFLFRFPPTHNKCPGSTLTLLDDLSRVLTKNLRKCSIYVETERRCISVCGKLQLLPRRDCGADAWRMRRWRRVRVCTANSAHSLRLKCPSLDHSPQAAIEASPCVTFPTWPPLAPRLQINNTLLLHWISVT